MLNVTTLFVEQSMEDTAASNDYVIPLSEHTTASGTVFHPAWVADRSLNTIDEESFESQEMETDDGSTMPRQQIPVWQQLPDASLGFEEPFDLLLHIKSPRRFDSPPIPVPMTRERTTPALEGTLAILNEYLWTPFSSEHRPERTFFVPPERSGQILIVTRHDSGSSGGAPMHGRLEVKIFDQEWRHDQILWKLRTKFYAGLSGAKLVYDYWSHPNTFYDSPFW
jgi:hypothetical protein